MPARRVPSVKDVASIRSMALQPVSRSMSSPAHAATFAAFRPKEPSDVWRCEARRKGNGRFGLKPNTQLPWQLLAIANVDYGGGGGR
jgi:hypothetical protein